MMLFLFPLPGSDRPDIPVLVGSSREEAWREEEEAGRGAGVPVSEHKAQKPLVSHWRSILTGRHHIPADRLPDQLLLLLLLLLRRN